MQPTVFDVAAYILSKLGTCTHMKLQKLVYYAQAWSLVWDETPLFDCPIQAWANGPVVPSLYTRLRGRFQVSPTDLPQGHPEKLTDAQRETVDAVLKFYGDKPPQWLSDLTHLEKPWLEARKGIPNGEPSSVEITMADMAEYYGSL